MRGGPWSGAREICESLFFTGKWWIFGLFWGKWHCFAAAGCA
jgi:hypothetical protein